MSHSNQRHRQRRRPDTLALLGTVGAVVSLAGVGWYWYSQWTSSSADSGQSPGDQDGSKASSSKSGIVRGGPSSRRPSMSILLPAEVPLSHPALLELLHTVTPLYQVHVIHHVDNPEYRKDPQYQGGMSRFSKLQGADDRRVLAYERDAGGQSVSRALVCDMHVHAVVDGEQERQRQTSVAETALACNLVRRNGRCRLFVALILPASPGRSGSEREPGGDNSEGNAERPTSKTAEGKRVRSPGPIPGSGRYSTSSDADDLVAALLNPPSTQSASGSSAEATIRIVDMRPPSSSSGKSANKTHDGGGGGRVEPPDALDGALRAAGSRLRDFSSAWS
ncbi:unnamed protein product [Jaminaea pallidilutea]